MALQKKKRRRAVGTANHEVADIVSMENLGSAHLVMEFHGSAVRHMKAQSRRCAGRHPLGYIRRGQGTAAAGIARRTAGGELGFTRHRELVLAAETAISPPLLLQIIEVLLIKMPTLRLKIRPVPAAHLRAFLPGEA